MTYYVKFNYIKKRCVKLYYIKKTPENREILCVVIHKKKID